MDLSVNYMEFGDVTSESSIFPKDEKGNPAKLAPMSGILDWFKKSNSADYSKTYLNGKQVDLSVVTLTGDEYAKMVVEKTIDPKVIYIVNTIPTNAYGLKIENVGEPIEDTDAATKGYVDSVASKHAEISPLNVNQTTLKKIAEKINEIIGKI